MRKTLFLLIFLLSLVSGLYAQTHVSGSNVQDSTGVPLVSGQWCFNSTCLAVTSGSFAGNVTPGTNTVTIVNASSVTILTVTSVTVNGASWNWNNYVVPYLAAFSGNGPPYLPCDLSAQYTQLDSVPADAVWKCQLMGGQTSWVFIGPPKPAGPGIISGLGAPTLPAVVPTMYVRTDTPQVYFTVGVTGAITTSWDLASGGSGSGITALSQDVAATGPGSVPATVQGIHTNAIPALSPGYLHWNGSYFAWDTPSGGGTPGGTNLEIQFYCPSTIAFCGDSYGVTDGNGHWGAVSLTLTNTIQGSDFLGAGTGNIPDPSSLPTPGPSEYASWYGPLSSEWTGNYGIRLSGTPPSGWSVLLANTPTSLNSKNQSPSKWIPFSSYAAPNCADSSGSPTAQSCTTNPSTLSVAFPFCMLYSTSTTNSAGMGVAVNGGSSLPVYKWLGNSAVAAGDIPSGHLVEMCLNSSASEWDAMTIGNPPSGGGGGGSSGGATLHTTCPSVTDTSGQLMVMNVSSTCSVPLPAIAAGYSIGVQNVSTSTLTITPPGGDTLSVIGNSVASIAIPQGQTVYFTTDGVSTYYASAPAVAGTNVTITPGPGGNTFAATGTSFTPAQSTKTTSYTITSADFAALTHFVFNCSSACTATLPATAPTAGGRVWIESIGGTLATVSLNGLNFNGASSVPVLNSFRPLYVVSDGSNYFGDAPLVAGSGMSFSPASNGFGLASSGGCSPGSFTAQTDGSTVTWAIGSNACANASLTFTTHGGSRTLNLTGMTNGGSYVLLLTQDSTGGEGLTLGTGCTWKVGGGGSGAISLSTSANTIDVLAWTYDGTNCYANFNKNFD